MLKTILFASTAELLQSPRRLDLSRFSEGACELAETMLMVCVVFAVYGLGVGLCTAERWSLALPSALVSGGIAGVLHGLVIPRLARMKALHWLALSLVDRMCRLSPECQRYVDKANARILYQLDLDHLRGLLTQERARGGMAHQTLEGIRS